jgi:hypothetical protein
MQTPLSPLWRARLLGIVEPLTERRRKNLPSIWLWLKPKALVKRFGSNVVMTYLNVDCEQFSAPALVEERFERCPSQTLAAVGRPDEQIIYEAIKPSVLHTETDRKHDVPDWLTILLDDPCRATGIVLQERREAGSSPLPIKLVIRLSVELLH